MAEEIGRCGPRALLRTPPVAPISLDRISVPYLPHTARAQVVFAGSSAEWGALRASAVCEELIHNVTEKQAGRTWWKAFEALRS